MEPSRTESTTPATSASDRGPLAGPLNDVDPRPTLFRDASFGGITAAQFLGAFNDNVYKQLVLLLCTDLARLEGKDVWQGWAQVIFSVPFVLFSGFAGYLADHYSKRSIVVLCKFAEVVIMLGGFGVFLALSGVASNDAAGLRSGIIPALAVLGMMGIHSAFFGPSKYGILPELVRERDLPAANSVFLATTFLAIIFGQATAGLLASTFAERRWISGLFCVGFALLGAALSLLVRKVPAADPESKLRLSSFAVPPDTARSIWCDGDLCRAILVYSLFWFVGGVVQPTVNAVGKLQIGLGDLGTSLMVATVGLGIGLGSALSGMLSRDRPNFRLVTIGLWGILGCLALLALPGGPGVARGDVPAHVACGTVLGPWVGSIILLTLGVFSGLYAVPLQVFLQARAPADQKGRVIAAMNLVNWFFIFGAAGFYSIATVLLDVLRLPPSWLFAIAGLILVPVALLYRPPGSTPVTTPATVDEADKHPDRSS
jgi:acyl-[acyl-carrier-protein]-phospholipid O-acyltransferase/long-chain-fatty-acid--[acyl-carrier-protein] ligase